MDVRSKVLKRRNETLPVPPKGLNRASGWMGLPLIAKEMARTFPRCGHARGSYPCVRQYVPSPLTARACNATLFSACLPPPHPNPTGVANESLFYRGGS